MRIQIIPLTQHYELYVWRDGDWHYEDRADTSAEILEKAKALLTT